MQTFGGGLGHDSGSAYTTMELVLETRDEFSDQLFRFGVTFGGGKLIGESGCGHRSRVLESRSRERLADGKSKTGEATLLRRSTSRDRRSLPTTFSEFFGFV